MKRRPRKLFKLVVFLLLIVGGAIVNVAVAWGFALLYPEFRVADGQRQAHPMDRGYWTVWTLHGFGYEIVRSELTLLAESLYLSDAFVRQNPVLPNWWASSRTAPSHWRKNKCELATGVPAFSFRASFDRVSEIAAEMRTSVAQGGIEVSTIRTCRNPHYNLARSIPLIPIWPGFAINTIFYVEVLWMVFALPFVMRRYFRGRRIKRGLCPACAYPVGGSPVCTECGKPVTSRVSRTPYRLKPRTSPGTVIYLIHGRLG